MSPRSRESSEAIKAASRARILAAAGGLFAAQGFHACRVADVGRSARMSPANLYWHFDSKEAILGVILSDGFGAFEAMAAGVADEYGPARRKLELLVDRTVAFHADNAQFSAILRGLRGAGGRELLRSVGLDAPTIEGRYRSSLRRVFAEARSEGAVAPADPDLLVTLFLAFFEGLAGTLDDPVSALPPDALRDAALRVVGYRPLP